VHAGEKLANFEEKLRGEFEQAVKTSGIYSAEFFAAWCLGVIKNKLGKVYTARDAS
jgi:hypothetical protein